MSIVTARPTIQRTLTVTVLSALVFVPWLAAQGPTPVSPGAATSSTRIGSSCPTFSWSLIEPAKSYELAVYEVGDGEALEKRLQVALPAGAGSWTPSAAECLSSGKRYGWAVRALTEDGSSSWSPVALFATVGVPSDDEVRHALNVLQRHEEALESRVEDDVVPPSATSARAAADKEGTDDPDRHAAAQDSASVNGVVSAGGAEPGTASRVARISQGSALTVDTDFDLGGFMFKSGTLFLHAYGENNTGLGAEALYNAYGKNNVAVGRIAMYETTSGERNTAVGEQALTNNTEGSRNTALGENSLLNSTVGNRNTAVGQDSMFFNTTGSDNTAVGRSALRLNFHGGKNTAVGREALRDTSGGGNVAVGDSALVLNTSGDNNTALGNSAGSLWTTGDNNVALGFGAFGTGGESATIRIGGAGHQTRAFIEGIRGKTTGNANAIPVLIDSSGQLGTVSSSARYKEDISDLGSRSAALMDLRPVAFRYKEAFADGDKPIQYGLIAEEVAQVFPELVVYDADGRPETVKYHWLSILLLNELQALRRDAPAAPVSGFLDRSRGKR